MAIIQMVLAIGVIGFFYIRLIRREIPKPIKPLQAVIPVVLGVLSVPLSFVLFLGLGTVLLRTGYNKELVPEPIRSMLSAFFGAGFPEETVKLLMMLLTILIFHKKIRNVYEYILIGMAVGFGFTILEEFFYGSGATIISSIVRMITIGAHCIFGIIMAKGLGTARYYKETGRKGVALEYVKTIGIPVLMHTLFDTSNGMNPLLQSKENILLAIGIIISFAVMAAMAALQVIILIRLKKNVGKYCGMEFRGLGNPAAGDHGLDHE